jgi:hypothetical protein
MQRAGDLKGELVDFAASSRFSRLLKDLVLEAFPGGVVDDEVEFGNVIENFIFSHGQAAGSRVIEQFVDSRPDLSAADSILMLSWLDDVEGVFEVRELYGGDGVIAFNHVDELTYQIRSNMGPAGIKPLTAPGAIMVGRVVPVGEDWMISGSSAAFRPGEADQILAGLPELVARHPKLVFRNPERLAQGWQLQAEQRDAFIELYGSDLVTVAGCEVHATVMAVNRRIYELAGSTNGPWTEPALPPLPEAWTQADAVTLIYDLEDGLSFLLDFPEVQQVFANPALVVRQKYHDIISSYLRGEGVSPVPIRRLAEADPGKASLVFQKLLRKPRFTWERDGEALLRRYKANWYAEPRLPRVIPAPSEVIQSRQQAAPRKAPAGRLP